jgi:hypothetical protein
MKAYGSKVMMSQSQTKNGKILEKIWGQNYFCCIELEVCLNANFIA